MAEQLPKFDVTAEPAGPEPQLAAADIPLLRIERVVKKFGTFRAVDGVSLDIRAGEFFALLGPSGCGKTTLLRMLAGFDSPDGGSILLDEPLAALDKKLRESTQFELMELQRRLGLTFVIVTHDQEEAMTVAGRIGVMDSGRLDQVASPRELYEAPRSRWIAEFVGDINLFDGEIEAREHHRLTIATRDAGTVVVAEPRQGISKTIVSVAIRPEKVKLSRLGPAPDAIASHAVNRLEGIITDVSYLGALTTYKVRLDSGATLRSSMANTARIDIDAYNLSQRVVAWFTPDDCLVLEQ